MNFKTTAQEILCITDSQGNLYVAEDLGGQRVQKFVFKGLGPATK
jgi:hypothetical protein